MGTEDRWTQRLIRDMPPKVLASFQRAIREQDERLAQNPPLGWGCYCVTCKRLLVSIGSKSSWSEEQAIVSLRDSAILHLADNPEHSVLVGDIRGSFPE